MLFNVPSADHNGMNFAKGVLKTLNCLLRYTLTKHISGKIIVVLYRYDSCPL